MITHPSELEDLGDQSSIDKTSKWASPVSRAREVSIEKTQGNLPTLKPKYKHLKASHLNLDNLLEGNPLKLQMHRTSHLENDKAPELRMTFQDWTRDPAAANTETQNKPSLEGKVQTNRVSFKGS